MFYLQVSLPLLALLAWWPSWVNSDSLTYCSSYSTGTSGSANYSIYQSNGSCREHCSGSAFGILQDSNCWCSNIAPNEATVVDLDKCDDDCPGYPADNCGNLADGYYGYIQLGTPSGTASAPSSSTTSTKSSTSSSTDTTAATTTTDEAGSTETGSDGATTVTSTETWLPSPDSSSNGDSSNNSDSSSSITGGTIAGIVVGVVGGIALIVAIVFFFLARRRSRASNSDPSFQNNLLDGRQSKGSRMSFVGGMFSDNHSHTLSAGSSITPQRMPTFTDNRMKTDTVLYANGRRDSSVSLQDNEDYSRPVLRLTNPD